MNPQQGTTGGLFYILCRMCHFIYVQKIINTLALISEYKVHIFTAVHGMQTQSVDEKAVCPSARLSVKRVNCDKTEERSVQIFIPYETSFSLVF